MRQDFTDFGGDERVFPVGGKIRSRKNGNATAIVAQSNGETFAEWRIELDGGAKFGDEFGNFNLRSENHVGIARGTIPEEKDQLILQEAAESAFA
jgi:hypothetical protein